MQASSCKWGNLNMALGNIFSVRIEGSYQFQSTMLTMFYQQATAGGDAPDLAAAIRDHFYPVFRPLMVAGAFFQNVFVINGNDNTDFANLLDSQPGTNAGAIEGPAFIAYAFRSPYAGPGTRYSYHRLWGWPPGTLTTLGGGFNAATQALLDTAAGALGTAVEGSLGAYDPVQIGGGFILGVPPTLNHLLLGTWNYNFGPSTQKTRQFYSWL